MVSIRRDPLTGHETVIVESRQNRPNQPVEGCPFCPGGQEAPEAYTVRWFSNRWPPLPDNRAEVVLYAPDHNASFWSLGREGAARVIALWSERTTALGARDDVGYVLVFENRGAEVGATIPHPHGQVYALESVPPAARIELGRPACPLCEAGRDPDTRFVVTESGPWRAVVPAAAAYPYELLIAPSTHLADLPDAESTHEDLAAVLVDALARLDQVVGRPMPYMLWIHQRPTDQSDWPSAHLHIHVAGIWRSPGVARFVAAGELGSGLFFNPVAPEDAAAALRAQPGAT